MTETHVITELAHEDMADIVRFIGRDNPAKARQYYEVATDAFFALDDSITHRRADPALPDYVRELPVRGFNGYSLRVMQDLDGRYFLLSAHRPGRSEANKNRRTQKGLRDAYDS